MPENLDLAAVAPLLCAGITTYSPLRYWEATKGKKVGIVGLGGLGHMGVKFSHALGAHTVVFTTSPKKMRCDSEQMKSSSQRMQKRCRNTPVHSTLFSTVSQLTTTSMLISSCSPLTAA